MGFSTEGPRLECVQPALRDLLPGHGICRVFGHHDGSTICSKYRVLHFWVSSSRAGATSLVHRDAGKQQEGEKRRGEGRRSNR